MDQNLMQFVEHARTKGMSHETIRHVLLSAGWKEPQIAEVVCATALEIPVPRAPRRESPTAPSSRKKKESVWPRRARDAFFHLLTFGALYTWATSLIALFFIYFDFLFPDPAWRISQARLEETYSIVRAQIAVVVIAFPIFLFLWHFLLREARSDAGQSKGGIRRWLGYLSIFVGSLTLAGDLMTLVYFLLEGQLTTRLLLKTGTLFLVAGSLVAYLGITLRSESERNS